MNSINGVIFDIKKYSINDGPGIRTTVFFKGCSLRCWWCHNPESQKIQPEIMLRSNRCIHCGACVQVCKQAAIHPSPDDSECVLMPITDRGMCQQCGDCIEECFSGAREWVGRIMSVSAIMREIERDRPFYDQSDGGVTFSGGEPLMQPKFLLALLQSCEAAEIHTTLDTSGYAPWRLLQKIASYVNLFLYDIKFIDNHEHIKYTGVSNQLILKNLQRLSDSGANLIVRIPLVPGINNDEASLRLAGMFLSNLPRLPMVSIIPYHSIAEAKYHALGMPYQLKGLISPNQEQLGKAVELLQNYGLQVSTQTLIQSTIRKVNNDT